MATGFTTKMFNECVLVVTNNATPTIYDKVAGLLKNGVLQGN